MGTLKLNVIVLNRIVCVCSNTRLTGTLEDSTTEEIMLSESSDLSESTTSILNAAQALRSAVEAGKAIAKHPVNIGVTQQLVTKLDATLRNLLTMMHRLLTDSNLALNVGGTHVVLSDETYSMLMSLSAEQTNHHLRKAVLEQVCTLG
jgi:hypothetical protein